jgi:hypothetical protein
MERDSSSFGEMSAVRVAAVTQKEAEATPRRGRNTKRWETLLAAPKRRTIPDPMMLEAR